MRKSRLQQDRQHLIYNISNRDQQPLLQSNLALTGYKLHHNFIIDYAYLTMDVMNTRESTKYMYNMKLVLYVAKNAPARTLVGVLHGISHLKYS